MNPKIAMALCGGLMFGVSVPVILAAWGNTPALLVGIAMLLSGGVLVASISHARTSYKLLLLLINALLAIAILIGILLTNPHTFLVIWSSFVILLAGISAWALRCPSSV